MKSFKTLLFGAVLIAATGLASVNVESKATNVSATETTSYIYDFVSSFSSYASKWSNSYSERIVSSADLGSDLLESEILLGQASKQTSTIKDRPVTKRSNNTFTLKETGYYITSFRLTTLKWNTKSGANFSVSYLDGDETVQLSSQSSCYSGYTWDIPSSAQTKEIYFNNVGNTDQVGYTSIEITVEQEQALETLDHVSVTLLPNKTEYFVGETFDPSGIVVTGYSGSDETSSQRVEVTDLKFNVGSKPFELVDVGTVEVVVTATYNGETYTASFNITVVLPPAIQNDFGSTGFESTGGAVAGTSIYSKPIMLNDNRFTLHIEASDGEKYRVMDAGDYGSGLQQIGTNDTSVDNWFIDSGILAGSYGVSVTRVVLTLKGTGSKSEFDVSAKLSGQSMEVIGDSHIVGTVVKTLTFVPSAGSSTVGDLRIEITNLTSGVGLIDLKIFMTESGDPDVDAAYSFAHDLELVNSCDSEAYAEVIHIYDDVLTTSQRQLADSLLLDDFIDGASLRKSIGVNFITVAEKMQAIKGRNIGGSQLANSIRSESDKTAYVVSGVLVLVGISAAGIYGIRKRKKAE